MAEKNRNRLPNNLPQLQNLIKRDPTLYKDEFLQQWRHYQSNIEIFKLNPTQSSTTLESLMMFIAHVFQHYQDETADFPQEIMNFLKENGLDMDAELRSTMCRALMLIRNKGLISPLAILQLFFKMFRCKDKLLRSTLYSHIVSDIKNMNLKHKNNQVNTTLQNFMFGMLKDSHAIAAKMSLDVMIELYRKNVWNDAKTVNVVTTACFSKISKVMVSALKFFLGTDAPTEEANDSDSDNEVTVRQLVLAGSVNKKTSKKKKKLEKAIALLKKKKKKTKPTSFNFSAIHLINDPQGFAEKLFKMVENSHEKFEVKLMIMNLIARMVGIHELMLLNFYPFLQRFLQPHQREVTKLLTFAAQSCHSLVPPDSVETLIKVIANNFITEKNSSEVIAVGLNAVREICVRCPLAMTSELLQDLVTYKSSKNKGIMMASRSLIQLFRSLNPEFLHKKDRGRPTEEGEDDRAKEYGTVAAKGFVAGAEFLQEEVDPEKDGDQEDDEWETDEDDDDEDEGGWMDVSHSSDEEDAEAVDETKEEKDEKEKKAEKISLTRILTDEDFKKIQGKKIVQQVEGKAGKKRKSAVSVDVLASKDEIVRTENIEMIYKRPKHDKEARMSTVLAGREGREKFSGPKKKRQNEFASTTNKEKAKKKPFMMISHSRDAKGKNKRSFREKQIALRDSLLKKQKAKY
eukprot:Seg1159.2 transcript_id=Seg1159.2/GoldUCD/mRNA.D3Y31 product="Protein SDA1" protein_id=Seg1159.2/GoldUCD/D3Y31